MIPPNRAPEPPAEPSNRPKPRFLWLAVALGAAGILGVMRFQPSPDASASATPSGVQATPEVKLGRSGEIKASSSNPLSDSFSEPQLILFVPDDNGEMKKRTLPPSGDIPKDAAAARKLVSAQAVRALMQASPDLLPPGTTLSGVSMEGGVATLNFSKGFADPSFWQGSARTTAAMDALAMTVAATKNQIPVSSESDAVRIQVEGKPLPSIGEMDLSAPYTPSAKAPEGSQP